MLRRHAERVERGEIVEQRALLPPREREKSRDSIAETESDSERVARDLGRRETPRAPRAASSRELARRARSSRRAVGARMVFIRIRYATLPGTMTLYFFFLKKE